MPLSVTDLAALGDTPITILSNFYPTIYLRMDATGVTAPTSSGGGVVNCEYGVDPFATFKLRPQPGGSYSFESVKFPGVFLRMDGTGVPTTMAGGGTVNCQFGTDANTSYNLRANADGSFSFESVALPGIVLRMVTGSGVTTATGPGGTVNCQINAIGGANESFFLNMADQNLNLAMQQQEQTMWCWDAVTVSVALYYNPNSGWTQCSLANAALNRGDCCVAKGATSPCGNTGNWPDGPLRVVGHLNQVLNNALTPVQLGAQIAKSTPVVCNISWAGGGGHIVALGGRSLVGGVDHVSVADPAYGPGDWTYNSFRNNYQNIGGVWNISYETQP